MDHCTTLARHPRHVALASLAAGLALAGHVPVSLAAGAGAAVALATIAPPRSWVLLVAVVALPPAGAWIGGARLEAIHRSPLVADVGSGAALRGHVVRRERESFGSTRVRVRVAAVRRDGVWRPVGGLVQVRARGRARIQPAIGDEVEASGALAVPGAGTQGSGYAEYLRRAGVHVVLHADHLRSTGRRRGGLAGVLDAIRRRAEAGVGAGLGEPRGALARGMVLGADEDIPDAMAEDFKRSGLAHVLAVSGQNVTLLAVLAWPLLGALGLSRGPRLWAVVGLIALYVPLTGAGPSIVRAGAMGIAGTLAALAGRPAARWYGLLVACVVTLALDPLAWRDVGWQLSFAAVIGIFALARPLGRALGPLPEPLRGGAALTVAATLATAPLMAFHFDRVSLAALPANLVALPAIAPVMWLGMLSAAAGQVALGPAELLNAVSAFCLAHVDAVARWGARLPGSALDVRIGSAGALAATYLVGAVSLWGLSRLARGTRVALLAGLATALTVTCAAVLVLATPSGPPRHFTATFLDVGQGDATLLQEPGGATVLVDAGPPGSGVAEKLRDRGIDTIDLAVLTHAQEDHEGGFEEVLGSLRVRTLLDGGLPDDGPGHRRIVAIARARGARVVRSRAGQRLRVGRGLLLRVVHAAGGATADEDPNLRATVILASYSGFDVFLPADAESEVTAALALPDVDAMKVAHHGSADEGLAGLLARLRPEVAVIEAGRGNRFGHPHPDTLRALRAAVPSVMRTDRDGDVAVTLQNGRARVARGR